MRTTSPQIQDLLDWVANVAIGGEASLGGTVTWHFKKTSTASTSQVTKYDENGEPIKVSTTADNKERRRREKT